MSERDFNGRVALVTGASRGIGRAIALELADRGACVALNFSSRSDAAADVAAEIAGRGGESLLLPFDVADPAATTGAITALARERGRLDILVNNAGITRDGLVLRYRDEDWQRTVDVNLAGVFHCARAALRPMLKARYGRIVNLSSVTARLGGAGQVAYAATKAGIEGLTRALAREVASRGVTVNAVAPGFIRTEMTAALGEEMLAAFLAAVPIGRAGEPEEVARAVAFLAGEGAGYISGHVLAIDGGMAG